MISFLVTDANFSSIASVRNVTPMDIVTEVTASQDKVVLSCNSIIPFIVYKWSAGSHFAISNKLADIAAYIEPLGYKLEYSAVDSIYRGRKKYVDAARDCSNVEKFIQWSVLTISRDGTVDVVLCKSPFTISLLSDRGVMTLLTWLKKYLIIARDAIREGNYIPSLTGGLDTRILTWFWRDADKSNINTFYLKSVKNDGKNNVEKGKKEEEIAKKVLTQMGWSLTQQQSVDKLTLSGMFTENARNPETLNAPSFLYDYISYHFSERTTFYSSVYVCPFADNLYLQLYHPKCHYMRTLLALLLCPDLLNIELYGYSTQPVYLLEEKFADLIPEVEQFISKYNLREKVAEIKKEVLG